MYNVQIAPFSYRFKIDINYTAEPPAVEVTITNLNDNIDQTFLGDLVRKCGPTDELKIFYHPVTNKHLGLARVVFETGRGRAACIDKYNGTSVMGKVKSVFFLVVLSCRLVLICSLSLLLSV